MTEYFDLYTADRKALGKKIQRGAPIPKGEYHIVVQLMTVNNNGEILLTQRVPQTTSGGKWECSGGCAISGETSLTAAARELYEETGIRVSPDEIDLEWSLTTDSMLRDFYIVNKNVPLTSIRLQSAEVCAAKWVSLERLEEMVNSGQTTRTVAKWLDNRRDSIYESVNSIKAKH